MSLAIVTIIKNIVESIPVDAAASPQEFLTFYYGPKSIQNKQDNQQLPVGFLDYPVVSLDELKQGGAITMTFPVGIFFCDKVTNLDSEIETSSTITEGHRIVIAKAWEWSRQFIVRAMMQNAEIYQVITTKRTEVINAMDTNLSGVFLEVKLVVQSADPICIE